MSALDTLKVYDLGDENDSLMSLNELRGSRAMVLDFWTTKCVKCPAALDKLNEDAAEAKDDVVFVSCALSQGEGNKEMVADLVGEWENLTHTFMEVETKELAKTAFGFSQVPFYVVVSSSGVVLGQGDAKSVDYNALLGGDAASKGSVLTPVQDNGFSLDEDF